MTISKVIFILTLQFALTVKSFGMVKLKFKNGSEGFRLTDKEATKLMSDKELRFVKEEFVEDKVYCLQPRRYELFSIRGKYLYKLGGTIYYMSSDGSYFDFIVQQARNIQTLHSYRFIDEMQIASMFSQNYLSENVDRFCKRNAIKKDQVQIKNVKDEIAKRRELALPFFIEQLSVLIFLKQQEFTKLRYIDVGMGCQGGLLFVMVNGRNEEYSPIDSLIAIYDSLKLFTW